MEPIPRESEVLDERGRISNIWHQFLYGIFGVIFKRLDELETTTASHTTTIATHTSEIADHEDRITTLEP